MAEYPDGVFDEVVAWLTDAINDALGCGVPREHLIVDPGIGFGKTPDHSIELLHRLGELKGALGGLPMLVGTSRKRFIGELLGGAPPEDRLEGTAATVALAIAEGADMVRVHDVEPIDAHRPGGRWHRAVASVSDRITLRGMRFMGRHGVNREEQVTAQPFEVDLILRADLSKPAATDDLADTIDYSAAFTVVAEIVEDRSYRLIERLAGAIAEAVLADLPGGRRGGPGAQAEGPLGGGLRHGGGAPAPPALGQGCAGSVPSVTVTSI